jgi:hypothetical protein
MTITSAITKGQVTVSQQARAMWNAPWGVLALGGLLSAGPFLASPQTHFNGGSHACTTDAGELQNALPRWGTIHLRLFTLLHHRSPALWPVTCWQSFGGSWTFGVCRTMR